MKEVTNTSKFDLCPEGPYRLTVQGVPEKRRTSSGKSTFRIWKFKASANGSSRDIKILLFPQESGELLNALGAVEIGKDEYEWDDETVDGKTILADIVHVKDKNGVVREKLQNISAESWEA
jgi:hypothetical protein